MTKEEFTAQYKENTDELVWASRCDPAERQKPDAARIVTGWTVEKPGHRLFNWLFHRSDTRILELEATVAWLEAELEEIRALLRHGEN